MIVVRKQQYATRRYEGSLRGDRGSRIRATAAPSDRSRGGRLDLSTASPAALSRRGGALVGARASGGLRFALRRALASARGGGRRKCPATGEGRQICLQPLDGAPQPVALNIDQRLDLGGRRQTLQNVQSSLNVLLAPREPAHRLGLHRLQ